MLVDVFSRGTHRQGRRGRARPRRHHRQQERDPVRSEPADGRRAASASARRPSRRAACGEAGDGSHRGAHRARRSRRPTMRRRSAAVQGRRRSAVPEASRCIPSSPSREPCGRPLVDRVDAASGRRRPARGGVRRLRAASRPAPAGRRGRADASPTAARSSPKPAPAPARRSRISCRRSSPARAC